ncbi:MAG: hypothetical protein EOP88_17450 [Verrucomicrobiaceae bacterium]|nr:MAG: hypothetical protein EOP88_17450 [Verrucomicrobiaceae bacterium]
MKSLALIVPVIAILSSCADSTAIQRAAESQSKFKGDVPVMGHKYPAKDVYRLYAQGATGFVSIAALREDVESRAEKFCERQGKGMEVLGERISKPPYILGNFPRIEIVFAAVPKR